MTTVDDLQLMAEEDVEGQPDLALLIEKAMVAAGERIHTAAPGIVSSASSTAGTVSARKAIARAGSSSVEPSTADIPVLQLRTSRASVTLPVVAGDDVTLLYADRSLDEWIGQGGGQSVTPSDPRSHDQTDAMALPLSMGRVPAGREEDLALQCGDAEISLTHDGDVEIDAATGSTVQLGGDSDFALLGTSLRTAFAAMVPAADPAGAVVLVNAILAALKVAPLSAKVKLG